MAPLLDYLDRYYTDAEMRSPFVTGMMHGASSAVNLLVSGLMLWLTWGAF